MLITEQLTVEQQTFLKGWGKNPEDYALVRIEVYDDPMNNVHRMGQYEYAGEGFFLVPKEHAQDVATVAFDFTHTNIRFFKDDDKTVLFSTIGEGYADIDGAIEDITAFHVGNYDGADIVKVLIGTSLKDESFSLFHPIQVKEDYYDDEIGTRIVQYDDTAESWMARTDIETSFYKFRKDELEKAKSLLNDIVSAKTKEEAGLAVEKFKALSK